MKIDKFRVAPGAKVKLGKINPADTGEYKHHAEAAQRQEALLARMRELQAKLYAAKTHALVIVLQGLDAAGKDGVVSHVMSGLNPEGTRVASFKQPTAEETAHDFLWRVHAQAPAKGDIVIFNRSHYEDVLVVRVHQLVPKVVWKGRYEHIRNFEHLLASGNGTTVLKFYLHISREAQLARFKVRLDEPDHEWKISHSDYAERELWDEYRAAFEEAIATTSTAEAPWFVIPSDIKWFRDLAISEVIVAAIEAMHLQAPQPVVDIEVVKQDYAKALAEESPENQKKIAKLVRKKEKSLTLSE
jgi:PPK2 family polyphosphate:nucleotide phosphotransferase